MATAAIGRSRAGRPFVSIGIATLAVPVALIGFGRTFFLPVLAGTFSASWLVYAHAATLFGWVGFFLSQTVLVQRRRIRGHRRNGWLGAALVTGVVASTLAVGTLASRRLLAAGAGQQAAGELFVVMLEMAAFAGLIAIALANRKRPEAHKRLMLLALIASLGPAWFRFRHYFPAVENPLFLYSILLADSLILVAAAADWMRRGQVHPVFAWAGPALILLHLVEVFLFDSAWFRAAARAATAPLL